MRKVYKQTKERHRQTETDRQTTDGRRPEKLTWAFSSGDLKFTLDPYLSIYALVWKWLWHVYCIKFDRNPNLRHRDVCFSITSVDEHTLAQTSQEAEWRSSRRNSPSITQELSIVETFCYFFSAFVIRL